MTTLRYCDNMWLQQGLCLTIPKRFTAQTLHRKILLTHGLGLHIKKWWSFPSATRANIGQASITQLVQVTGRDQATVPALPSLDPVGLRE